MIGVNGSMTQVKCVICFSIDGCDKILVAKINSLWKHVGCQCAKKDIYIGKTLKVKFGEVYFLKDIAHVKNKLVWSAKQRVEEQDGIQELVQAAIIVHTSKKRTQFVTLPFPGKREACDKLQVHERPCAIEDP